MSPIEERKPKVEWYCPKCSLLFRVDSDRTLAIDQALHLKRHELRGE